MPSDQSAPVSLFVRDDGGENECRVSLYYRDDRSDKEYHLELVRQGDGWVVNYRNGRRGGNLQGGTKHQKPVSYEQARGKFNEVLTEKLKGGYTPGKSGVPFSGTEHAGRDTTHRPQLLTPIDDPSGHLEDPRWWLQEKKDGHRVLVEKRGPEVIGANKKGLARALPEALAQAVAALPGDFVLDGELVGSDYHVFDLLGPGPYSERLARLTRLWGNLPGLIRTARTTAEKRQMLAELREANAEGFVLKRHDAPYKAGRHETQLKHKFLATASCIVIEINAQRSVQLGLHDKGGLRFVGNVTIHANRAIPPKKAIVEVSYLYAYPNGSLIQAQLEGIRTDIEPEECTVSQLKYKAGTEDDEDA